MTEVFQPTLRHHVLLTLYLRGDRLGASVEGMPPGAFTAQHMLDHENEHPQGTDESDIVRCMLRFFRDGEALGCYTSEEFACAWSRWITKHHSCARYGKTWRDFFQTVKALDTPYQNTTLSNADFANRLRRLSVDRNSHSNGGLALLYPIFLNLGPGGKNAAMRCVAYSHEPTRHLAGALYDHFCGEMTADRLGEIALLYTNHPGGMVISPTAIHPRAARSNVSAAGCILDALAVSKGFDLEDCLARAAEIGGDVDSYLSLGLLLWGMRVDV